MSYAHQMISEQVADAASLAAAADIVTKEFLMNAHIRRVAVRVTTQATVTAPVVDVYWRPTAGSDTGRVLLGSITGALADWDVGNWLYVDVEGASANAIKPGGDLVVEVSTAATAGAGDVHVMYSQDWETPANIPAMIESTT